MGEYHTWLSGGDIGEYFTWSRGRRYHTWLSGGDMGEYHTWLSGGDIGEYFTWLSGGDMGEYHTWSRGSVEAFLTGCREVMWMSETCKRMKDKQNDKRDLIRRNQRFQIISHQIS